jgi:hypothetical protein
LTAVSFPRFFNGAEIHACHGALSDPLPIVALRGAQAMAAVAIHVVPDDNFDDWIVRADIGQEFGHYLTEKPPNGLRRRSRKSARPNSSSTSRTEEPAERILQKAGPPDCSGDDPAESADALLHLHAVELLVGPC